MCIIVFALVYDIIIVNGPKGNFGNAIHLCKRSEVNMKCCVTFIQWHFSFAGKSCDVSDSLKSLKRRACLSTQHSMTRGEEGACSLKDNTNTVSHVVMFGLRRLFYVDFATRNTTKLVDGESSGQRFVWVNISSAHQMDLLSLFAENLANHLLFIV